MTSCSLRFANLVGDHLKIFQWVEHIVNLVLAFSNIRFFEMKFFCRTMYSSHSFLWILIPLLPEAKIILRDFRELSQKVVSIPMCDFITEVSLTLTNIGVSDSQAIKIPCQNHYMKVSIIFYKLGRDKINCFTYIYFPLDDQVFW